MIVSSLIQSFNKFDNELILPGVWVQAIEKNNSYVNDENHINLYRMVEINDTLKIERIRNDVLYYETVRGEQWIRWHKVKIITTPNKLFRLVCNKCNKIVRLCLDRECMAENSGHHIPLTSNSVCGFRIKLEDCNRVYYD